jgi:DNA repair exonuclease SbcCD ATPase subunit
MGIFSFFKKKIKEETGAKLSFEELRSWLDKEKKKNKEKEMARIGHISSMISHLAKELKEERAAIQKISLDGKRIDERLKSIVIGNLSNFSEGMGDLIKSLEEMKKDSLLNIIDETNRIFVVFRQKSAVNYGKASFIIDKELTNVNESIRKFLTEMKDIIDQEKDFIQRIKTLSLAESSIMELKSIEKLISGANERIEKIEREKKSLEEKKQGIEKMAEEIKKSKEYNEEEKKKHEAMSRKNEMKMKILELRELINFKSLAKTFHENEKKMKVIKSYEHDLSQILENDAELITLLDEAKKGLIKEKIEEINQMRAEIQSILGKKDRIEELKSEISRTEDDIEIINSEKMKEQNRLEKLDDNLKAQKNATIEILAKINVELSQ